MKVILDYLVNRPLNALFNGTVMGLLLPVTMAHRLGEKAGRVWAILLTPVWLVLIVIAIPLCIVYCFVMVMWKGPLWQYPPDKRGPPIDWSKQSGGSE